MGYLLPKEETKNKWQLTNEERTDIFIGTIRQSSAKMSHSRVSSNYEFEH
jgi:hypothetical protein